MKIIFLDVDGVLNNELFFKGKIQSKNPENDYELSMICPRNVSLLNGLIEKTESKIVVSSSWRKGRTLSELKELFTKAGIIGEVIDKTPVLDFERITINKKEYTYSVVRGCEIKAWIEMNTDIYSTKISKLKYVILDDDSDMLYWQRNNFLQVDPYTGLTPQIIHKAIQILNY